MIGDVAAIFGCCLGIKVHSKGKWDLTPNMGLKLKYACGLQTSEVGDLCDRPWVQPSPSLH